MNEEKLRPFIGEFVRIFHDWSFKIPLISENFKMLEYSLLLSETHRYIFEKYLFTNIPEDIREKTFQNLIEWN